MRRPGLVVIGTDTGVGKTCVAAGLVRAWRRKGIKAVPWKPFASGVPVDRLEPGEDADILLRAADDPSLMLADVSPCRFAEPLAPAVAAKRAGVKVDVDAVLARYPKDAKVVVVEGCGGLRVPLAPGYDVRELCWDLDLPVLIVARPGLGTINHIRLTVESAQSAGLYVIGVVICNAPREGELAESTNVAAIRQLDDIYLLGVVPHVERPDDPDTLADAIVRNVPNLLATVRALPDLAEAAAAADRRCVWHPFTQMKQWLADDSVVIDRARGPWLYDSDGRRYLDAISSLWVNVHGHRNPRIDDAVRAQLGKVAHSTLLGLASSASAFCAMELLEEAPSNLSRVFYSDSGSTAVEVALKMAFQRAKHLGETRRRLFVRFEGAYHGDTIGAVSLGGIDVFHQVFGPLLFETLRLPPPYAYRRPDGVSESDYAAASLARFEQVMRERGHEIAAVIVEPVMQGAAGMIPQPQGWLPRVAAATKSAGALLICDEVATGFGRTGKMFAVEHEGVEPDMMCVAKGLTGGYLPLAATLTTEVIHDAFLGEPHENKTFFHGHTYTGNPLACAAAIANLELMRENDTVTRAAATGELLGRLLADRLGPHPHVGDIRRRGMMVGVELVRDRETKEAFPVEFRAGHRVCKSAMDRGVRIRPLGDVIVLMPPLSLEDDLVEHLVRVLVESIDAVTKETR